MVDFWVSWAGVGDRGLVAVKNFKKGVKLLFVPPSLVITSDLGCSKVVAAALFSRPYFVLLLLCCFVFWLFVASCPVVFYGPCAVFHQ
ncbi:hypothetical protein Q3G72_035050 [Acer saccharum]|nr:hypothetical protein Q3G72_035050 [Acer saccharum]